MLIKMIASRYGHTARVEHSTFITKDNLHVIELKARCGQTLEISRVTIGAVDGKRLPPPTREQLQHMLDTHRQRVADEASWKETVRENIQGIE